MFSNSLISLIQACVGQESCSIEVSGDALGAAMCNGVGARSLAVQATC